MKKIVLVANVGFTISNFRKELIETFLDKGDEVVILCKRTDDLKPFEDLGVKTYNIPLVRHGMNPFKELELVIEIYKIFKLEKPDIILNYTIKPNLYGSLMGAIAGVPTICSNITGLGVVFTGRSLKRKIFRQLIKVLYWFVFRYNKIVFFQNKDDFNLFAKATFKVNEQLSLFADLQNRNVSYKANGVQVNLVIKRANRK